MVLLTPNYWNQGCDYISHKLMRLMIITYLRLPVINKVGESEETTVGNSWGLRVATPIHTVWRKQESVVLQNRRTTAS